MWTRDFKEVKYQVSIHEEMYEEARKMIINLEEELRKRYGDEVAAEVTTQYEDEEGTAPGNRTSYTQCQHLHSIQTTGISTDQHVS